MARRNFLKLITASALHGLAQGCSPAAATPLPSPPAARARSGPSAAAAQPARIAGICFDLFTLFDPRSVTKVAEQLVGEKAAELCALWRSRQFEYAWLRVAAGRYVDFRVVTAEALLFACKSQGIALAATDRERLVDAYSQLELWSDSRVRLQTWKSAGLRLAPLANYAPSMLEPLIAHAKLEGVFDELISTDRAKTFKPDPRAYALGPELLGLRREEIAFAAFGGWDAAGAKWFGYPTFWVNRLGLSQEDLPPGPDATGPTLTELDQFISQVP